MSTQPATIATFSGLASGIDTNGIISKIQAFAQKPITQLMTTSRGLNDQLTAYQSFNAALAALQSASSALTLPTAFNGNTATSSTATVATITATSGAPSGSHTLTVNRLAQAQQIVSNNYSNNNLGLNQTGTFTVNGRSISVTASDSLTSIASKINGANAGVTASVVTTGVNQYQLSITSNKSGVAQTISAVDTSGTVLSNLGLVGSGAAAIRQLSGTNAFSITTTSASTALGSLFGYATGAAPSGTVTIGDGVHPTGSVSINLNTDSLSAIAGKINAAGITGIQAQIISLPDANGNPGGGGQQLQITSSSGVAPVFTDSNSVLGTIGVLQKATASANQPLAAQDANITFDGLTYTRASNTIGDLIAGASVTLLQQTPSGAGATPATTTLTISQNTPAIVTSVQNFATAYNNVVDFINNQNQFTKPTGDNTGTQIPTQPLFGSQVLTSVQAQLGRALGVSSGSTTLGSIGVTIDSTSGHLMVNTGTLTSALQSNTSSVQSLFGLIGNSSNSSVQFVAAGPKTQQSSGAGYAVNITTAAAQSTATATVANTGPSTSTETLTFSGLNFPSSVSITLNSGNTLQATVNQINGNSQLNGIVTASIVSNKLVISSIAYGSTTGFTVTSNQAASSTNSGLGSAPVYTTGTDVAGTINGEAATGRGQTLTGKAGNKKTDGLVLTVTATSAGSYGSVTITQGIATQMFGLLSGILDPTNGQIATASSALNTQITNNQKEITNIQAQVSTQVANLQQMFSAMETRVSKLQSQGQAFSVQAQGLMSWNNSSSGH